MKKIILLLSLLFSAVIGFADEGMWLPIYLAQLNEKDMQARGMKISAEDIYSANKSSMKDAVVLFGGGCTGEIISNQGLLLTNHHCGFSSVQALSSLDHDYVKNGYWSFSPDQELPCPGLTVTFIISMQDVTAKVLADLKPTMTEQDRESIIKVRSAAIEKEAASDPHYTTSVKSFYYGNQYFLFVMEVFKDVRLVGVPPLSIGEFGGDTDNWMWPRHTGDFSLFRIYADKNNEPADYSKDNKPYIPKYSFPISLKGIQQNDFTMVYGFPGRTTEYIPSYAVSAIQDEMDPVRIKIRDERLQIIEADMKSSDKVRLQYIAKRNTIANGWKKWQGELKGIQRLNTVAEKQKKEVAFREWVAANNKKEYDHLLDDYEKAYSEFTPLSKVNDYINEAAYGVELLKYAHAFNKLISLSNANPLDENAMNTEAQRILNGRDGFFKNYDQPTDIKTFVAMMNLYYKNISPEFYPKSFDVVTNKMKGDFQKYAEILFSKSALADSTKLKNLLTGFNRKKALQLQNDPAYALAQEFWDVYTNKIETNLVRVNATISVLNRKYMAARMEMQSTRNFYPEANLTLRVAYGNIQGYDPRDAVTYKYYTTIDGIMEKEDTTIDDYVVSDKLKELYRKKDYGQYAVNGTLPVAFIATNHTSGGNSGSPVINANGELIGTNFDRVWEGTMSDIEFDPEQCRNISLDIHYTLFVIDKFAGCKRLIDEMKIVTAGTN